MASFTPTPMEFVFQEFESSMRLNENAQTYAESIPSPTGTFKVESNIPIGVLKSSFYLSTDEIDSLRNGTNVETVNFITDSRPWKNFTPAPFAYYPAQGGARELTDYTTAPTCTALTAWLAWLMFKITNIKDSTVLIKNVDKISDNMSQLYENYLWKQVFYSKLWAQDFMRPSLFNVANAPKPGATTQTYVSDFPTSGSNSYPMLAFNSRIKIDGAEVNVIAVDENHLPVDLLSSTGAILFEFKTEAGKIVPVDKTAKWGTAADSGFLFQEVVDPNTGVSTYEALNRPSPGGVQLPIFIFDSKARLICSQATEYRPVNNVIYDCTSSPYLYEYADGPADGPAYSVMQFYTGSDVSRKSIGQKILEKMVDKDLSRFASGRLEPAAVLVDPDGNQVGPVVDGVVQSNIYSLPFAIGDKLQYKVNVMVPFNNILTMFGASISNAMQILNQQFNLAATEHEHYVSFVVTLNVVADPIPGA